MALSKPAAHAPDAVNSVLRQLAASVPGGIYGAAGKMVLEAKESVDSLQAAVTNIDSYSSDLERLTTAGDIAFTDHGAIPAAKPITTEIDQGGKPDPLNKTDLVLDIGNKPDWQDFKTDFDAIPNPTVPEDLTAPDASGLDGLGDDYQIGAINEFPAPDAIDASQINFQTPTAPTAPSYSGEAPAFVIPDLLADPPTPKTITVDITDPPSAPADPNPVSIATVSPIPEPTLPGSITVDYPPSLSDPTIGSTTFNAPGDVADPGTPGTVALEMPREPTEPPLGTATFVAPSSPDAPSVSAVSLSDLPTQPDFEGMRPTIDVPAQPPTFNEPVPAAPSVEFQESPTVTEFVPPTITPLPDIEIPEFTWSETMYDSALLQAFNNKLLGWINGLFSTGLNESIEKAIWDRARERTNAEVKRLKNNVTRSWSAAGWTMPAPSMANALLMAEQEAVNKTVEESRSVAVAQAELEQKNLQFAFSTTMQLETQMMNYTNSMRQRLFEAQKASIELMVQVYQIMQQRVNVEVAILQAQASVWETTNKLAFEASRQRLELEKTKVEVFGAQIQAFSAQVQANGTQWDSWAKAVNASLWELEEYKADADVFKAKVDAYRGLVDAKRSQAEVELQSQKLPIDLYQARIQGYSAQVDAAKTKTNAEIELAKLPLSLYETQVRGYAAKVDAAKSKADIELSLVKLPFEVYDTRIKGYAAKIDAEKAKVDAELQLIKLPLDLYESKIRGYAAQMEGAKTKANVELELAKLPLQKYDSQLKGYQAQVEAAISQARIEVDLAKLPTEIYDSRVKGYASYVDAVRTKATAETEVAKLDFVGYDSKVRAYQANVDAQVQKGRIGLDVIKLPHEVYDSQVKGYAAAVDAEKAKASVNLEIVKLPLETYKASVQGYAANVDGISKKSELELKKTMLPLEVYKSEVDAYQARAQAETAIARLQADLKKLPAEVFKTETEAFTSIVEAESKRVNAILGAYTSQNQAWKTSVDAQVAALEGEVKLETYKLDGKVKNLQLLIDATKAKLQTVQSQWTTYAAVAEASGKIAGNLAASALSSVNLSAGMSDQFGESNSADTTKWNADQWSSRSQTDSLDEYPPVQISISQQGQL